MPEQLPSEHLVNLIRRLAENECHLDDKGMDILDLAGTSFDDAYNVGFNDGQVSLARKLLAELTRNE
jgi:hypothetical protein